LIDKATYSFLYFFSRLLSLFPRKLILTIGSFFGLLLYTFLPVRKKVAKINLNIAFPNKNKNEINRIIKKTYQHYGLLMFEFIANHKSKITDDIFNIDDKSKEILNDQDGLIFMTAHLGNWEMVLPIISKYKKLTGIVRTQKNSGADKFFHECRQHNDDIILLSKKGSKREMLLNLKKGHVLGLASDQNAHNRGTQTSFFGKKASFPKGAGHFNFLTNLKIIFGFCILKDDYSYDFKLEYLQLDKHYKEKEDLISEINKLYVKKLENQIENYPNQYFWFHKKWDKSIYDL
tara:strand:- start:800 stop:1669 length:870 start_codon:yes stop_codon:yes gene_type:complete